MMSENEAVVRLELSLIGHRDYLDGLREQLANAEASVDGLNIQIAKAEATETQIVGAIKLLTEAAGDNP